MQVHNNTLASAGHNEALRAPGGKPGRKDLHRENELLRETASEGSPADCGNLILVHYTFLIIAAGGGLLETAAIHGVPTRKENAGTDLDDY